MTKTLILSLKTMTLTILLLFSISNPAISQKVAKDTVKTDPIVITAERNPVLFSESGRTIKILSKTEIESSPVASVQDLLKNSYNLDIRQRGNFGVQADISTRGGTFEQTSILLNGININDPQTSHHNFDIPVDLESISKIEILDGSASRVLGPNASSGAINLITDGGRQNNLGLSLSSGMFGYLSLGAHAVLNTDNFDNLLSFSYKKSSGYTDNTDFKNLNLYYLGQFVQSFGKIHYQFGYMDKAFGANSFYTPDFPNQFEATKTILASAGMSTGTKYKFMPEIYWRRHQDKFELFRDNPPTWYTSHNYHMTDIFGIKLDNSFISSIGVTNFGAGIRSENILSNVLGHSLAEPLHVPGETNAMYYKGSGRNLFDAFLEHNLNIYDLTISGGLYLNYSKDYKTNVYPGLDLSYRLNDNFKLFANYNRSLRLPSFTELYYSDPTSKGNAGLKPETADSYELGTKFLNDFTRAQISVFTSQGTNLIDWTKQPNDSLWRSTNLTSVNSLGFNLSVGFYFDNYHIKSNPFHYVNISYQYLSLNKAATNFLSEYVLDYLRNKLSVSVNHDIIFNIKATWNLSLNDRAGSYSDYATKQVKNFEPYFLVNGKIYTKIYSFQAYLDCINLFDVKYVDISNVKLPGRWISAGLKYDFEY